MFDEPYAAWLVLSAVVFVAGALVYGGYVVYDALFKKKLVIPPELEASTPPEVLEARVAFPWDGTLPTSGGAPPLDDDPECYATLGSGQSELTQEDLDVLDEMLDETRPLAAPMPEPIPPPPPSQESADEFWAKLEESWAKLEGAAPKQALGLKPAERHEAKDKLRKIKRHVARKPKRRKKIPVSSQARNNRKPKRAKRKK